MNKHRNSLRTKLILTFLVVIIIGGLLSLYVGFRIIRKTLVSRAQAKVRHDLASAWMVFNGNLHEIETIISLTAKRKTRNTKAGKRERRQFSRMTFGSRPT